MSISDEIGPFIFRRDVEKTLFMRNELDGKMNILRPSPHVLLFEFNVKVLLPFLHLDLDCKQLSFSIKKGINTR